MDEYTRTHYDAHATNTSSKKERAEGLAAPLKTYHNTIKRHLIRKFASKASSVLDIGCGRGGDLAKWNAAGIERVLGIDISPLEIEEASRRYREGSFRTQCTFRLCADLATAPWCFGMHDVITCMFAFHYFCASETMVDHVFRNMSASIKHGGYVILTIPDGEKVMSARNSPVLTITKLWTGAARPFGCAYMCDIANTVTAGGSIEYLVLERSVIPIAARHGFVPITRYDDATLGTLLATSNDDTPFKHFSPTFPDPDLKAASSLFAACVLQKM